jgi:hypothetical protein
MTNPHPLPVQFAGDEPEERELFEAWAQKNQPWLLDQPDSDSERLVQMTARTAFSAGRASKVSP